MVSLKQRQSGFTIVELLIVIVIIGILATLVIVTFSGVQQKARDSERKTDINGIASQMEAFYAQEGYYPAAAQVNDSAWRGASGTEGEDFKLDSKALADPSNKDTEALTAGAAPATAPATKAYYLQTLADGGGACTTAAKDCKSFVLTSFLENTSDGDTYTRESN
tara:strand:+ start:78 stop:572 length:495 start_codon:yes stop_codon:yes gene_type:complete